MLVFFSPSLNQESREIALDENDSRHAVSVLRLKERDEVWVFNGKGIKAQCQLQSLNKKACVVDVKKIIKEEKRSNYTHIAIAPTKQKERLEFFVEKATEIGVDEISFIETKRTIRSKLNLERIQKITVAALKQSQNPFLPKLNPLIKFSSFVQSCKAAKKWIAVMKERGNQQNNLSKTQLVKTEHCILIGPEGGFTKEEITFSENNGFTPISLGKQRLRTETAGIAASILLTSM